MNHLQVPDLPDKDDWGPFPSDEFIEMVAGEIKNDIDREIIEDLKKAAEGECYNILVTNLPDKHYSSKR